MEVHGERVVLDPDDSDLILELWTMDQPELVCESMLFQVSQQVQMERREIVDTFAKDAITRANNVRKEELLH